MFDIVIRRGDTLPKIRKTLYVNGVPQNLTGYTINFVVDKIDGTQVINNAATAFDIPNGIVEYHWTAADSAAFTDTVGFGKFVATAGSETFTVPNNSPLSILVTSDTVNEFSYSGDPSARPIDTVRFLMGDTDMSKALLTDSEISFILTEYPNPYDAAAEGALTYAARYTDLKDKTVGPLSIRYGETVARWQNLAKSLARRSSRKSGALAITTQASTIPAFKRGMNDFPQSPLPPWQDVLGEDKV